MPKQKESRRHSRTKQTVTVSLDPAAVDDVIKDVLDKKEVKLEHRAHGFFYQVGETRVLVRNRPRSLEIDCNKFQDDDLSDAYLSVTDSFVTAPKDRPLMWFPWNEGRKPIPEMYYATNKILSWWIRYEKRKTVQIFCDGGTHRSVTVFGAYLRTFFSDSEAREIVGKRVELNPYPGTDLSAQCQPLEYIDAYLEEFPADRLLFKAMAGNGLGRLDRFSRDIYDLVKKRYGDDKPC